MPLIETPATGLYDGTSDFDYRCWDAINQSALWTCRKSLRQARYSYLHPTETSATRFGSYFHRAVLDPKDLSEDFAIRPPGIDGRTKEGKAALAEWKAESEGKILLTEKADYDAIEGLRQAVREHPLASELLAAAARKESSGVFKHPDGQLGKLRIDLLTEYDGWSVICDLKTTKDASPRAFTRSITDYGYHLQAAYYLDGLNAIAPADRRFFIIACEKTPPYDCCVYEMDLVFIDAGRAAYKRYLEAWTRATETGIWPGYSMELETLEAPEWLAASEGL